MRDYTRHLDADLLHSKLQCGPTHNPRELPPVWACNFPGCFLESGGDFLPLRVLESRPQISIAAIGDWLRLSMSAHCLLRLGTKVKLDRQFENWSDRDDHSPLDHIL
jgi:hypothetical protein